MSRESGMSLIEMMVGLGLVGLIAYGISTFMHNTGQNLASQEARASFEMTSKQLLKLVERDIRLQAVPSTINGGGLELKVTRLRKASPNLFC